MGGLVNALPYHVWPITAGNTYRLRVINGGLAFPMVFSVDDYDLKVVAADGAEVEPYVVQGINLHVAERYDVEISFPPSKVWKLVNTLGKSPFSHQKC